MATDFNSLVTAMNPAWLDRHGLVPIALADGRMTVAARGPCSSEVLAGLRFAAGCDVEIVAEPEAGTRREPGPSLADRITAYWGFSKALPTGQGGRNDPTEGIDHFLGRRSNHLGNLAEIGIIAIPVAVAWHGISLIVAVAIGALAILASVHLQAVMRAEAGSGRQARTVVLRWIAVLSDNGLPEARAVGCGLTMLGGSQQTQLPLVCDRETLADALHLADPLRVLLVEGDLGRACAAIAAMLDAQADRHSRMVLYAVRVTGGALFATALILLMQARTIQ